MTINFNQKHTNVDEIEKSQSQEVSHRKTDWVKPELISLQQDGIDGKQFTGPETSFNYQGAS